MSTRDTLSAAILPIPGQTPPHLITFDAKDPDTKCQTPTAERLAAGGLRFNRVGGGYCVEGPSGGPECKLRFTATLILPKAT